MYPAMSELAHYRQFIDSYNAHKQKVYNYFYFRTGHDQALAEDLTSETFLKAYEGIDSYRADFAFSTWIYAIARNTLTDHYRKSAHRVSDELPEELPDEETVLFTETLDQHIDIERIRSHLSSLPEAQRTAIEMRYFQYQEVADIAAQLEAEPSAVRKNISRGLERLREMLGEVLASLLVFLHL